MASTATRSSETSSAKPARLEATSTAISSAADSLIGTATDAAARLPDLATTTRSAFADANRRIQDGNDEMLTLGTALSFGFALGLLIGGASRILVAVALVPAAMMGLTLFDRSSAARSGTIRTAPGGR